ncbi:MAG: hypothetical protein GX331_04015 [Firmicutes bacterium]|jgi:hypothetical protein|nr:hypothetical protein [Bacillota bacterium]
MKPFYWISLIVLILIVLFVGVFIFTTPRQEPHSASEQDIEARVMDSNVQFPNLEFSNIKLDGERILVEASYTGTESIREQADWFELALTTAQRLHKEVVLNRGVEVRIYQDKELRGVAIAGI